MTKNGVTANVRIWLARSLLGCAMAGGLGLFGDGAVPSVCAQSSAASVELQLFRIGTGGPQGTYFPIGNLIAAALSEGTIACDTDAGCGIPGLLSVAQLSNGSVSNVKAISAGVLEAGLVQADVAYWAYSGTGEFAGGPRHTNLRAIASLYQESVHIVVARRSHIARIPDLRGLRVSLDEPGSGTLVDARIVLHASGLTEKDLRPVYIKPQFAAEKLLSDGLDAYFIVAGHPTKSVVDLSRQGEGRLIPVDGNVANEIRRKFPFLTPTTIPADTYAGIAATATVGVSAQLLVSALLSEDLVYEITRTLWSERTRMLLGKGHPRGKDIRLESALEGVVVPLHPGAERFYRERKLPLTDS